MLLCDFFRFFKSNYSAVFMRRTASSDMIIARFFCMNIMFIKMKNKRISKVIAY